ncbi:MAG: tRNA (adenosine(37)-N6)-threonylcarbamoyltransferase complex dimerization subunit type 1 TsaB [Roseinatronobacter sp.]
MPSEPVVLGFDTSAAHCAAALVCGDQVLAERALDMAKGQAEALVPLLEQVLQDAGKGWRDLAGIGVGVGPGNFTGIRLSVATARGLALGLGVPAIGVTMFDACAHGLPRPVRVAEDARRGAVYVQDFAPDAGEAALLDLSDAVVFDATPVTGSAARAWAQATGAQILPQTIPLAVAIAQIVATRLTTLQPRPAPFYLRAADAAPPSDPPPLILP